MNKTNKELTHKAIELILMKLYSDTFEYPECDNTLDRFDEPIEPDYKKLYAFRDMVLNLLSDYRKYNDLTDLNDLIEFVLSVGQKYNHIWGYSNHYTITGTWGVRYQYLRDIPYILDWNIPINKGDIHYFKNGFINDQCDIAFCVDRYATHFCYWFKFEPIDKRVSSWWISHDFSTVHFNPEYLLNDITRIKS